MSNVPRIEGTPDPRESSSIKKDGAIDSEKFKKILKVDESDETEQRRKRNLGKSEEEQEEDIEKIENSKTPETLFSSFMSEPKNTTSIFDAKEGKKQSLDSTSETPSPSYNDPSDTLQAPPSIQLPKDPQVSSPDIEGEVFSSSDTTTSTSSQPKDDPDQKKGKTKEDIGDDFKKKTATTVEKSSPSPRFTPPPKAPKKELPIPEPKLKKAKPKKELATVSKPKEHKETSEAMPPPPPEPKRELSPSTKEPTTDEITLTKKVRSSEVAFERDHSQKDDNKKEKEESFLQTSSSAPPLTTPIPQHEALPTYAHFDPQVFELFERMVGLITVEQLKGVSTTTVKISLPGTVFHGSEIKLEHYDTAPHSFNIKLIGSPEAVKSFTANFEALSAAFRGGKYAFEVNLLRPELASKERHLIQRKSKPGKNDSNKDENPSK